MQIIKRLLSILLALVMILSVFTVVPVVSAGAAETAPIPYVNAKGEDMPPVIATPLGDGMSIWSSGWYYADGEFTISSRVAVEGEINLILCDGAVLNIPRGITLNSANISNLTIWQQKNGTGMLNVTSTEYGNALYLYRVEAYEYFNRNQGGN